MTLFEASLLMILSFGFSSIAKEKSFERFFEVQGVSFAILVIFIAVSYFF